MLWRQKMEDKIMKRLMAAAVAGLLAFGAAEQAPAATYDLGTLNPGTASGIITNIGVPAPVSFSDTINFSLVSIRTALVGSITDLAIFEGLAPLDSTSFSLDLFREGETTSLGNFSDPTGVGLLFSYLDLAIGNYFFLIEGDVNVTDPVFGNAYAYSFEVSEVPLPPALLLFATALGGMALFGYRRRNSPQV